MIYFTREYLVDELELPYAALSDIVVGTSRWVVEREIIFESDGRFYQTSYSEGATENQYQPPWEYEKRIACHEVELKEVMVEKWVFKQ